MELTYSIYAIAIAFVIVHSHLLVHVDSSNSSKVYIVQVKSHKKPPHFTTHTDWHRHLFQSLTSATQPCFIYNYNHAYPGFSAQLTSDQVESLRRSDSIARVREDTLYTLHTTHTPNFLGLDNPNVWKGHNLKELNDASQDVIIGVVDSGVWPQSDSFKDNCMPNVPSRWQGKCEFLNKSYCNKKLIGARFFNKGLSKTLSLTEEPSPQDNDGHGTHTASTAAGSLVLNASLFGLARGNARGVANKARVAVYKPFWEKGVSAESDILAAMDSAIGDGVDVLSLSVGPPYISPSDYSYDDDTIAVGAFRAMRKGIFVSCAAGNGGPSAGSVVNIAPWIMTVGAGTIDRNFPAYATLGNNKTYGGASSYYGKGMGSKLVELVYPGGHNSSSNLCLAGSLDRSTVEGKVVLCDRGINDRVVKGLVVKDAGGVAMILANTNKSGEELVADIHYLPALAVGVKVGDMIRNYVKTTKHPTALLRFLTVLNVKPAPVVAAFSSRGPNTITPEILKPDVIGPGVNILAAWPGTVPLTKLPGDSRRSKFNIISGTSMSCPHISGLAALLKAAHPEWSPSAIKSALMTTAYTVDNTNSFIHDEANNTISNPWGYGAGHVNLQNALSPGLIYNTTLDDYIAFLCSINYTIDMIQTITNQSEINCNGKLHNPGNLNYPSFSVVFGTSMVVEYTRELTNVDHACSTYNVFVEKPPNVTVIVKPSKLVFRKVGDKKRYTVTFTSKDGVRQSSVAFGSLTWKHTMNQVKSPVSVTWMGS